MSTVARTRLATLRKGIDLNRVLLSQLLTLARVQKPDHHQSAAVFIQQVFRQVLQDLMPQAKATAIDLGVFNEYDYAVMATQAELHIFVKNLADNAIHHTPPSGRVDLSVQEVHS